MPHPLSTRQRATILLPGRIRHGLTDRTFALSFLELNDG